MCLGYFTSFTSLLLCPYHGVFLFTVMQRTVGLSITQLIACLSGFEFQGWWVWGCVCAL